MNKNIKSIFHILRKFRLYSIINIVGLALSLSSAIIVLRYIHQEVTVDHYIPQLEQTYLLVEEFQNRPLQLGGNSNPNNDAVFKDPLDDPTVEISTIYRLYDENNFLTIDEVNYNINAIVCDNNFLKIFPFPLYTGVDSLRAPTDAIITRKLAKQLFGNKNPLGETFKYSNGHILTIVGVVDEPNTKTSISFDVLISSELEKYWNRKDLSAFRLLPGTDYKELQQRNNEFMMLSYHGNVPMRFRIFPMKDFYFDQTIDKVYGEDSTFSQGNYSNVLVLSIVVILLLIVGLFNFINIYTVIMLKRAKEFGIKKVYGASGWKIFIQIYLENFVSALFSLLIVWVIIEITVGIMETWLLIPIKSDSLFDISISAVILFIFPLLTSIYPAIKYNHSSPITSIRSVSLAGKSIVSRSVFLFLQYVITFCLIVISLFFVKQLHFMLNSEMGYKTNDIIRCVFLKMPSGSQNSTYENDMHLQQVIDRRLAECPLFETYAFCDFLHKLSPYIPVKKETGEYHNMAYISLNTSGMKLYDFQLVEGRLWNDSIDRWAQYRMIINETAKKLYDIKDIHTEYLQPEDRLWWSMNEEGMDKNPAYEIVGVIKDFKTNHLSKGNVPVMFVYEDLYLYDPVVASIVPGKRQEAISFLQNLYEELIGVGNFEYTFLEDEIEAMYEEDKRITLIYITFAIIAILISCLGLFGLSLFDIRQRHREIALRKVNGATVKEIFPLLLKRYFMIFIAAFVFSIPLTYALINKYLENFANKATVSWWLYAIAALLIIFISFVTLNWQVRKAASINPAEVLKGE